MPLCRDTFALRSEHLYSGSQVMSKAVLKDKSMALQDL